MNTKRLFVTNWIFGLLPPTRCFPLKAALLRWAGARVGRNVRIVSSARFWLEGDLSIGDNAWIGHEVLVVGGDASVELGADIDVGPRVMVATGSHELFTTPGKAAGKGYSSPIIVGNGAWLGAGVLVLGGTHVGERAVCAAGALVNTSVEAGQVVGGVPAKPIMKSRADAHGKQGSMGMHIPDPKPEKKP